MTSMVIKEEYLDPAYVRNLPRLPDPAPEPPMQQGQLDFEDPRFAACREFVRVAAQYYQASEFLPGHEGLEDKMGKALDAILAALEMEV